MISLKGIVGFIPSFPAEHQQKYCILCCVTQRHNCQLQSTAGSARHGLGLNTSISVSMCPVAFLSHAHNHGRKPQTSGISLPTGGPRWFGESASFFGWLTFKGNSSPRKGKERAPNPGLLYPPPGDFPAPLRLGSGRQLGKLSAGGVFGTQPKKGPSQPKKLVRGDQRGTRYPGN